MTVCKVCGEEVLLAESTAGTEIVLGAEPRPLGILYLDEDGVARPWEATVSRGVLRYASHSYICPNSAELEVATK